MKKLIILLTLIYATQLPILAQYVTAETEIKLDKSPAVYHIAKNDPQEGFTTVFTPEVSGTDTYVAYVQAHCKKSLYAADFTFTSQPVTDMYCKLARSGIDCNVILDKLESKAVKVEATLIAQMRRAGVKVTITTSQVKHRIMHNKFTVLDDQWVIDGSWNYTSVADQEANTLNFNNIPSPERASLFLKAWHDLYDFAQNNK